MTETPNAEMRQPTPGGKTYIAFHTGRNQPQDAQLFVLIPLTLLHGIPANWPQRLPSHSHLTRGPDRWHELVDTATAACRHRRCRQKGGLADLHHREVDLKALELLQGSSKSASVKAELHLVAPRACQAWSRVLRPAEPARFDYVCRSRTRTRPQMAIVGAWKYGNAWLPDFGAKYSHMDGDVDVEVAHPQGLLTSRGPWHSCLHIRDVCPFGRSKNVCLIDRSKIAAFSWDCHEVLSILHCLIQVAICSLFFAAVEC